MVERDDLTLASTGPQVFLLLYFLIIQCIQVLVKICLGQVCKHMPLEITS